MIPETRLTVGGWRGPATHPDLHLPREPPVSPLPLRGSGQGEGALMAARHVPLTLTLSPLQGERGYGGSSDEGRGSESSYDSRHDPRHRNLLR